MPEHPSPSDADIFDHVIVGSGFGGSVSALRLTEKGYRVLVLERGKRWRDQDFPTTNWIFWKYLWLPVVRAFGILQLSFFRNVFVLHGSGVGGGSLGYATVLMEPDERLFAAPGWHELADWRALLRPHFETAKRMLGVAPNPRLSPADHTLSAIAQAWGRADTFQPTTVGIFFGQPGQEGQAVADPFFAGQGPERRGCTHCGGCMVGCRHNAKNTLVKNYLYFAELGGAEVRAEAEVRDIRPLPAGQPDGARYAVVYRRSTAWGGGERVVRTRNVIVSAGTLGTLRLLFRCREVTGSLPRLSHRLGEVVRTNSESLLGVTARGTDVDYSQGIAITSFFKLDEVTSIEPVRYPAGSDLMRLLSGPLIGAGHVVTRVARSAWEMLTHLGDFLKVHVLPGWAKRSTILLVMQTEDNYVRMRWGRGWFTLFRRGLVSQTDTDKPIPTMIPLGHQAAREFAARINGIPLGSFNESLFEIPITAHILGGCRIGRDAAAGVVGLDCQAHNYPGLYVVDGSIMPANPGVNPSLTITALAEYAMSLVPARRAGDEPCPSA